MSERIAVASRSFSSNKILRKEISDKFQNVKFNDTGKDFSSEELVKFLSDSEIAIISTEKVNASILSQLPTLKVISKYGVGLDNVDLDAVEKQGIQIAWQGGVNRRSVAELALAFMLSLLRHIPLTHGQLKNGVWNKKSGRLLSDKTVGIVGCGYIGKDLVTLLKPFGAKVQVYDIKSYDDFYKANNIKKMSFEELLSTSDIVTLHIPLNDSTRGMIDAKQFSMMKPNSLLINTARGSIVNEDALKEALRNGKIAAAAFDVFAVEPFTDRELLALDNFLATPHIAGNAEEAVLAMGRAAIEGLDSYGPVSQLRELMNS